MPRDANRVAETSTTPGTGTLTLGGAILAHQTFATAYGVVGATDVSYSIVQDGEWEVGFGAFLGPSNALQRNLVLDSSAGGGKVNFPSGTKKVFVAVAAEIPVKIRARRATDVGLEIVPMAGQTGNLLQISGSTGDVLEVEPTAHIRGPSARFGDVRIGILAGGDAAPNRIGVLVGSPMTLQSGNDVDGTHYFMSADETVIARMDLDNASALVPQTLMTRRKGDTRYARADANATISGTLTLTSHINMAEQSALQFGTLNEAGSGFTRIQPTPGATELQFFITGSGLSARIEGTGTTVPLATSVITREKGDTRYQTVSSKRFKSEIKKRDRAELARIFGRLEPKGFRWGGEIPETDERRGTLGLGFIAEDVVKLVPEAGRYVGAGRTRKLQGIDPMALVAVHHGKISELDDRLTALEGLAEGRGA